MKDNLKIKRALISVSDKTGLLPLAKALVKHSCEIISTGGTARYLTGQGIPITDITSVTGNPEAFNGRMKTISFEVASALLFDRERDAEEAASLGIKSIDMVICNLYPFEKYRNTIENTEELIEYIDIGGPTMLRAAAKNYISVASVCSPERYGSLIEELERTQGCLSHSTRLQLMTETFLHTAEYDSRIAETLVNKSGKDEVFLRLERVMQPRYGENSHQQAGFYKVHGSETGLWNIGVHNGIELSYNNILDLNAALEAVLLLNGTGCAIIKHNNPCGYAQGKVQREVFEKAWGCDTVSAFGGIVAFNTAVNLDTVRYLDYDSDDKGARKFIEIIAAPGYSDEALEYLKLQKKLRVVSYSPDMLSAQREIKIFNNSALIQKKDTLLYEKLECVTTRKPDILSLTPLIEFGIKAVQCIKSNAIALVRTSETGTMQVCGKGIGQPNRVNSVNLCLEQAGKVLNTDSFENYPDLILVSDAFFPFEDNIDFAHKAGIKTIVQPGGSIRDKQVIERCNEYGISMIFTGARHFKH